MNTFLHQSFFSFFFIAFWIIFFIKLLLAFILFNFSLLSSSFLFFNFNIILLDSVSSTSNKDSKHFNDQVDLFAQNKLKSISINIDEIINSITKITILDKDIN